LQLLVFIAQRLDGTMPTWELRAGQNGANQPFSHEILAENKLALSQPIASLAITCTGRVCLQTIFIGCVVLPAAFRGRDTLP
jgi:hypothetical protein